MLKLANAIILLGSLRLNLSTSDNLNLWRSLVLLLLVFIKIVSIFKKCWSNGWRLFWSISFEWYKEYNSCLISFLSFSELFPAFNWARVIGNLLSIWSGVSIFSLCPLCFRSLNSRILSTISIISFGFSI